MTAARCPGCDHVAHRDQCRRKAPGGCATVLDPATGQPIGTACYRGERAPCPCPYGWCHQCRAVIVGAATLPLDDGSPEIDVDPDPAGDGALAVWPLPDGQLACRRLADGEQPRPGEWRGRQHAHQLTPEEAVSG